MNDHDPKMTRTVKLVKDREGQILHIPADWEFSGDKVKIEREGDRLILSPQGSLRQLLDTLEPCDEEFPEIDDPPPEPVDL